MTTILNDTNISELLKVSSGNFDVLEKLTEEFRQGVQAPQVRAETTSASSAQAKAELTGLSRER